MKSLRIVSLCPSTTETLIEIGLEENIVGRTLFCIHPEEKVSRIKKVGGTKNPNFEKIKSLKPTHIMFNLEENDVTHLEEMKKICKTVVTTPTDISTTIDMLRIFGDEFSKKNEINKIVNQINFYLDAKRTYQSFSYLYFIWNEPKMIVGRDTYIDYMLSLFGGKNLANSISEERYIVLDEQDTWNVDKVFLSSEPFPFKEKHIKNYIKYSKNVEFIDGEMVSWHGSRTPKGLEYLDKLLG